MSASERQGVKDQLEKWKQEKEKKRLADVNQKHEYEEQLQRHMRNRKVE